jgi:hypothetical protein
MSRPVLLILLGVIGLVPTQALSAPKPKENIPTEKELKEFATKVVAALINKDIDGFLDMCEPPFHRPGGYFAKDKEELRQWITKALGNGQLRQDVKEVKGVETFGAAKARFSPSEIRFVTQVLADSDFVVDVEMEQIGDRKHEKLLLIRVKSGKLRLVGWKVRR